MKVAEVPTLTGTVELVGEPVGVDRAQASFPLAVLRHTSLFVPPADAPEFVWPATLQAPPTFPVSSLEVFGPGVLGVDSRVRRYT